MDESPALALRNKKDSSMRWRLIKVKSGDADACVSAGNTGALMAISRFVLKMLPGIDRPAICAPLPTVNGHTHMLDLGANVDCGPEHLCSSELWAPCWCLLLIKKSARRLVFLISAKKKLKVTKSSKLLLNCSVASDLNFVGER